VQKKKDNEARRPSRKEEGKAKKKQNRISDQRGKTHGMVGRKKKKKKQFHLIFVSPAAKYKAQYKTGKEKKGEGGEKKSFGGLRWEKKKKARIEGTDGVSRETRGKGPGLKHGSGQRKNQKEAQKGEDGKGEKEESKCLRKNVNAERTRKSWERGSVNHRKKKKGWGPKVLTTFKLEEIYTKENTQRNDKKSKQAQQTTKRKGIGDG